MLEEPGRIRWKTLGILKRNQRLLDEACWKTWGKSLAKREYWKKLKKLGKIWKFWNWKNLQILGANQRVLGEACSGKPGTSHWKILEKPGNLGKSSEILVKT